MCEAFEICGPTVAPTPTPKHNAYRPRHGTAYFARGAGLCAAASTDMKDEIHFSVNANAQSKQPRRIIIVQRVVAGIDIRPTSASRSHRSSDVLPDGGLCERISAQEERVNGEELRGRRVVNAAAEVDESGVAAGVLGVVAECGGGGAFARLRPIGPSSRICQ